MDKILLKGIACQARVGVFDWERQRGCRCEIDLELALDLSSAGKSDQLSDTLDYASLQHEVVELAEHCGYHLLERLADEIARLALNRPGVDQVHVVIKKKETIGLGPLDYAGVEITRRR